MLIHRLIYANLLASLQLKETSFRLRTPIHLKLRWRSNDVETTHDPFPSNMQATYTHSLGRGTSSSNLLARRGYVNPEGNKYNNLIMAVFMNEIILTVPFLVRLNHSPPGHVIGTNGPSAQVDERIIYIYGVVATSGMKQNNSCSKAKLSRPWDWQVLKKPINDSILKKNRQDFQEIH